MNALLNPPAVVRDAALLVARVLLGVVLIAHGLQKFGEWTIAGTTQAFGQMGVPAAGFAAPLTAVVELVGGVLLLVGLFAPIAGAVVALIMLAAAVIAHVANGVFVANGGWELVGVIAAAALAVGVAGPGRWSVDAVLTRRGQQSTAQVEPVATDQAAEVESVKN